ncbi:hypothetical protein FRC10_002632 [Ceratobasidium sp. 414]|nr:hypothetical protein FRC10_002632 [Ceratobasidium sp. 414]
MQTTFAPNSDPLPTSASTSCVRSTRKPVRWAPYGSRSAPPTVRRESFPLKATPEYSLPLSPRLTPESNPSTGQKSHAPTIEEIPEATEIEKHVEESHEKKVDAKGPKKYECTDDFIGKRHSLALDADENLMTYPDVMLGILSLIYCSPLLISGGRTFVIPQNFTTQPPPLTQPTSARISTVLTQRHHTNVKPNHMRWFVERLLERTRPPRAVCQLAVAYLVSLTDAVQSELRTAAEGRLRHTQGQQYPPLLMGSGHGGGGRGMPISYSRAQTPDNQLPPPYSALPAPTPTFTAVGMPSMQLPTTITYSSALLDPRRVLLAAMVLAHKFHLDKTWTNKAWGKISGLTPIEVGRFFVQYNVSPLAVRHVT